MLYGYIAHGLILGNSEMSVSKCQVGMVVGVDLGMDQKHQNIYEFDQLCLITCQQLGDEIDCGFNFISCERKGRRFRIF